MNRDFYHIIWAALTLVTQMKGTDCAVRVVHCSGTIKKCQLACVRYDRGALAVNSDEEDDEVVAGLGDLSAI